MTLIVDSSKKLYVWEFQVKFYQAVEEGTKVVEGKEEALQYCVQLKDSVHSGKKSVTINGQEVITGVKM